MNQTHLLIDLLSERVVTDLSSCHLVATQEDIPYTCSHRRGTRVVDMVCSPSSSEVAVVAAKQRKTMTSLHHTRRLTAYIKPVIGPDGS